MSDTRSQHELKELLAELGDGGLNAQQLQRLEEILRDDAEARRLFHEYVDVHLLLEWMYSPLPSLIPAAASMDAQHDRRSGAAHSMARSLVRFFLRPTPLSMSVAAVVMCVFIAALAYTTVPLYQRWARDLSEGVPRAPVFVAELSDLHNAVWAEGQVGSLRRAQLVAGHRMQLQSGLAEITFRSGAQVLLEGPAELTLNGIGSATLDAGRLTAKVPKLARGFTIDTKQASIVDLGTEFGVSVAEHDPVSVVVFKGSVEVQAKLFDGRTLGDVRRLTAGQAIRLTDACVWSPVAPAQRVQLAREMPKATGVAEVSYDGGLDNGFPHFLNPAMVNATTRAWNLHGSAQTLNGVTLQSASASVEGLEITGNPGVYAATTLNWRGDSQASAKNDIANTGLVTIAPNSWGMKIDAVVGRRYRVQLLSNAVANIPVRRFHVLLDGVRIAHELVVPATDPWAVVYTFEVTADDDGIDLQFVPSVHGHANPYLTAIAVSESPATPAISETSPNPPAAAPRAVP